MLEGWSSKRKDGPLDKWAPSKAAISAAINFAIATGRLEDRSNDWMMRKQKMKEVWPRRKRILRCPRLG